MDNSTPPFESNEPVSAVHTEGEPMGSEPTLGPPLETPQEPPRSRALVTFGLVVVGAVILIFAAQRYSTKQALSIGSSASLQGEGTGQLVPDFALKDIHGNTMKMSDLKGKVVILDFWATWCAPCKIEIPWFQDMYNRYKGQGLEVVGVAMDDEQGDVKPFVESHGMNYRVLLGNDNVATQFGGIFGLPTTYIIGRDGKIQSKHMGLVSKDTFEQDVKKLL